MEDATLCTWHGPHLIGSTAMYDSLHVGGNFLPAAGPPNVTASDDNANPRPAGVIVSRRTMEAGAVPAR